MKKSYEKKSYVCENYEKICLCLSKAIKLEKLWKKNLCYDREP